MRFQVLHACEYMVDIFIHMHVFDKFSHTPSVTIPTQKMLSVNVLKCPDVIWFSQRFILWTEDSSQWWPRTIAVHGEKLRTRMRIKRVDLKKIVSKMGKVLL